MRKKQHSPLRTPKSRWEMASHGPGGRHDAVKCAVALGVNRDLRGSDHNSGCSSGLKKGRFCNRFGSFPAYYRGRRDFLASCKNGATNTDSSISRDRTSEPVERYRPSESRDPFFGDSPGALLVKRLQNTSENGKEGDSGGFTSLYDLDWRLGSIADFSEEIFADKVVLDLGCNIGKISFIVASLMQARRVVAVDVDATLISKARTELNALQHLHGLPVMEKSSAQFSQHRKSTVQVDGNKGAGFCLNKSFAERSNEKASSLSMPSAAKHKKRKMPCALLPYVSSPIGARRIIQPLSQGGLRCGKSAQEDGLYIGEIPSIQSGCVNNSTSSGKTFGDARLGRIQTTAAPRATRVSASAGSLQSMEPPSCQGGKSVEREGSLCCAMNERESISPLASRRIAPRKRLCTKASALPSTTTSPGGIAEDLKIGGRHEAVLQYHAGCSDCFITQCPSKQRGGTSSCCEFPYNISLYVADALAGEPWRLPTVCGSRCTPGSTSASCFCGLAGRIRDQQQQLASETSQIEDCCIKPDCFCESSSGCQKGHGQRADQRLRASFGWERFGEVFDVVICFSLTKWIHLHHGDKGILLLFSRLHALLKAGGLLLLEPQDWASYRRARRVCASFQNQLKSIRLHPRIFCSVLTSNRTCSCSGELLILKGSSSSKTCETVAEEFSETPHTHQGTFATAAPDSFSCPSHGCPFRLLARLHPWSDLQRKEAAFRVKNKEKLGSSITTYTRECEGDRCREVTVNDSLLRKRVKEATQDEGACHRGPSPPTICESRDFRSCRSSVVPQGAGASGENDVTTVKAPGVAAGRAHRFSDTRKTDSDEVMKNQEDALLRCPDTRKKETKHTSQEKQHVKSRGTLADRFVYVLEKVSSDFTVCCKQLQKCAHAKAACTSMVDTDVRASMARTHCVRRRSES